MDYVIIGLLVVILFLEIYKIFIQKEEESNNDDIIDSLKEENNKTITTLIKEFGELNLSLTKSMGESAVKNIKDLNEFKDGLTKSILTNFETMNRKIEEQMDRINRKVELRLDEGFEKTNKTFNNIVERLTRIDEAQKNIDKLSTEVVSLQHLLSDKKSRGTFGEVQLNNILSSIFGEVNESVYGTQVTLSNGKMVDAMLYLPETMGNLAIDSKFPLENYRKMVDRESTDVERTQATRAFKADVKKHVDAIATKYIIPMETSDQAVMFVPAEAIFAEINAYHQDVIEYAQRKRVWIASPTTIMSLLTTVQVLLNNAKRDKNTKIIQQELIKLGDEFRRYNTRWSNLSKSIKRVNKDVDEINITSRKIEKRFEDISKVEIEETPQIEE